MKWLLPALGSAATVAALANAGITREPPSGIELVLDDSRSNVGPVPLGTFEIDSLEGAASARAALTTRTSSLALALAPGLYGLRFVPDPDLPAPAVVAMEPTVLFVAPRAVTRVDVRLRVVTPEDDPRELDSQRLTR
jgi:hypothetical protein